MTSFQAYLYQREPWEGSTLSGDTSPAEQGRTPHRGSFPPPPSSSHPAQTPLLTIHEAAALLRVDDSTVRRWISAGQLKAVSLPHQGRRHAYRIKRTTLDALLSDDSSPPPGYAYVWEMID